MRKLSFYDRLSHFFCTFAPSFKIYCGFIATLELGFLLK